MPTLTIKNTPQEYVIKLRQRAKQNHRSLQGELMRILEQALFNNEKLNNEQAIAAIQEMSLKSKANSTRWVREERDAR